MKHLFWVWIVIFFTLGCTGNDNSEVGIEKGILNLDGSDPLSSYELKGDWAYISGEFVNNVDNLPLYKYSHKDPKVFSKSKGNSLYSDKATFYTKIISSEKIKPALYIPALSGNINVYVNDELVYHVYQKETGETNTPIRTEIIDFPKSNDNIYHVFLQTSPSVLSKNLIHTYLKFGDHKVLEDEYGNAILIKIFIAASFIILGIFLLTMFIVIPRIKSLLYFALFSLFIALRLLVTGEILINYFFDLPWETIFKLEYLTFYCGTLFTALFMQDLFKHDIKIHFFKFYIIVMSLFIGVVLFSKPAVFFHTSIPFQVFLIIISIHPIYQIIRIAIQGNYVARIFLTGFLIFYITIINDILYLNQMVETVQLFHYGTLFLIISMSFLLPMYFTKLYKKTEVLNRKVTQQNEELNKINTDLERFVYSVTHDLKAPLASLEGLVNIAKLESKETNIQSLLQKQENSIVKLKAFIDEILTISRNNQTEVKFETIELETLINDTVNGFSYLNNSDKIEKSVFVNEQVEYKGDLFRLKTILRNLISNGIKYGDVKKQHPFLKIKAEVSKMNMVIEVTDNGLGIPEDHQKNLFNMFFRAHDKEIEGTGLGLYIVKECVDLLEGTVKATSIEKIGTSIFITLPNFKYKPTKSLPEEERQKNPVKRRMKILSEKTQEKLGIKMLKRA